jgi:hypothetical protein
MKQQLQQIQNMDSQRSVAGGTKPSAGLQLILKFMRIHGAQQAFFGFRAGNPDSVAFASNV